MESAFVYTGLSGDERRHLTDRVTITPLLDADEDELLDGVLLQDVRSVRLAVEIDVLIPPTANRLALAGVWLDLIRAQEIRFMPDTSRPLVSFLVRPDLSHRMTLLAVASGVIRHRHRLRLKSVEAYAPGAALLTNLVTLVPTG